MSLLRSFCIAFGMYSKIPMPKFEWNPKDMRYTMCFFPLISIPIALLVLLWFYFCQWLHIHSFLFACVISAIPVLVTGGIHLDGYCDTVDALSSRQPREKAGNIKRPTHRCICCPVLLFVFLIVYRIFNRTFREFIQRLIIDVQLFAFPLYQRFCRSDISQRQKQWITAYIHSRYAKTHCSLYNDWLFYRCSNTFVSH